MIFHDKFIFTLCSLLVIIVTNNNCCLAQRYDDTDSNENRVNERSNEPSSSSPMEYRQQHEPIDRRKTRNWQRNKYQQQQQQPQRHRVRYRVEIHHRNRGRPPTETQREVVQKFNTSCIRPPTKNLTQHLKFRRCKIVKRLYANLKNVSNTFIVYHHNAPKVEKLKAGGNQESGETTVNNKEGEPVDDVNSNKQTPKSSDSLKHKIQEIKPLIDDELCHGKTCGDSNQSEKKNIKKEAVNNSVVEVKSEITKHVNQIKQSTNSKQLIGKLNKLEGLLKQVLANKNQVVKNKVETIDQKGKDVKSTRPQLIENCNDKNKKCTSKCEYFPKLDANGCETCDCCPLEEFNACDLKCKNGYSADKEGCPLCECS